MLLLLLSLPAEACGPYFDHPRLSWVGREMLSAPRSSFDDDIRVLANETSVPDHLVPRRVRTSEGDAIDLRAAGVDEELVQAYLSARLAEEPAPDGVPLEFALYQEAVLDLRAFDLHAAEAGFLELLALPADERHYRSTWAAYMLPMARPEDAEDALRRQDYQRVRELAEDGFEDTLGLAVASLRQEGAYTGPAESLSSCLQYRAAGGVRFCSDLHYLTARTLAEDREAAAADPLVAQAVSAFLTAHPDEPLAGAWLETADELAGADRLAWAAYQRADFEAAAEWASRAPDAPMSHWMLAKLAVRSGDLEAAVEELSQVTAGPVPEHTSCPHHGHDTLKAAHIELGILLVATERYDEALLAFLDGGDWLDAAWVGERLLTTDELLVLVERNFPRRTRQHLEYDHAPVHDLLGGEDLPDSKVAASMRHLLARRLARDGRWSEAIGYFPYDTQYSARQVLWGLRRGGDEELSDAERGRALWSTAFRIKQDGFELLATEMEPDFRVLRGWYSGPYTAELRADETAEDPYWLDADEILSSRIVVPTADELERAEASGPPLDRRYHWVWTAFELAERGTDWMDPSDPELPQALCTAGKWQRQRDPAGGERLLRRLDTLNGEIDRSWWLPSDSLGECRPPTSSEDPAGCSSVPIGVSWLLGLWLVSRRRSVPGR